MSLLQGIFAQFVTDVLDLVRNERRDSKVKHKVEQMSDAEWADWRNKRLPEIRVKATELASQMSDKELIKSGEIREDLIRRYELLLRNADYALLAFLSSRSYEQTQIVCYAGCRSTMAKARIRVTDSSAEAENQRQTVGSNPPSVTWFAPVRSLAEGEARKVTSAATSSAVPGRPSGMLKLEMKSRRAELAGWRLDCFLAA